MAFQSFLTLGSSNIGPTNKNKILVPIIIFSDAFYSNCSCSSGSPDLSYLDFGGDIYT